MSVANCTSRMPMLRRFYERWEFVCLNGQAAAALISAACRSPFVSIQHLQLDPLLSGTSFWPAIERRDAFNIDDIGAGSVCKGFRRVSFARPPLRHNNKGLVLQVLTGTRCSRALLSPPSSCY